MKNVIRLLWRMVNARSFKNAGLEFQYRSARRQSGVRIAYVFAWLAAASFVFFSAIEYFAYGRGIEDAAQLFRAYLIVVFIIIGWHSKVAAHRYERGFNSIVVLLLAVFSSAILYNEYGAQFPGRPEFFYVSVGSMCILLTIATYGFVRLPLLHAAMAAGFISMATLATIYASDAFDWMVAGRLVTYLAVANVAGLILHRITEIRERRLFLQAVRLKNVAALRKKLIDAEAAASEAKTRFLAMLSHEVRTPMHAIVGLVDMVHEDLKEHLDEKKIRAFELVSGSCDRLLATFDDMLEYAHYGNIEAAQRTSPTVSFYLDKIIEESCQLFQHKALEKGLALLIDTSKIANLALLGDPPKLARVIVNIVSNAIKFTAHGWVKVIASHTQLENGLAQIRITISDSGIGIPEADLARIFQAFYQVDASYTRRYEGSGLGLAICKQIVVAMSGSISVSSAVGSGTEFIVDLTLPLARLPSMAYAHQEDGSIVRAEGA